MIGISAHSGPVGIANFEVRVTLGPQSVVDRVAAAGCVPLLLPPVPGIEHAMGRLDGLVLPGGPDLDPALYGAQRHPKTGRVDQERDAAELALLAAALDGGLPLFAICRGMELLNVLRGGTLHQYVPEICGHHGHSPAQGRHGVYGAQRVRLEPGSLIARAAGTGLTVPCHHSQAIDRLGAGLAITGRAEDGTIEAVEVVGHPFAVGVQWHDEERDDPNLFVALAEAARPVPVSSEA